jgi:hypothetical protein
MTFHEDDMILFFYGLVVSFDKHIVHARILDDYTVKKSKKI